MKKTTIILLLLICTSAISQTVLRLQKVENYDWITDEMKWEPDDEDIYTYGNEGSKETTLLNIVYSNQVPVDNFRYLKTYNSNNLLTQNTKQNKIGMDWVNDTRNSRTYDIEGRILLSLDEKAIGENWQNQRKEEIEYPDENTTIQKDYEPDGDMWFQNEERTLTISPTSWVEITKNLDINETLVLYSRDETIFVDSKIDEQISQIWDNGSWLNSTRYKVHYDSEGLKDKEEVFEWNADLMPAANWELTTQILYTRSNINPKLIRLYQDCSNGPCENSQQIFTDYYPDGSLEKSTTQVWELLETGEWADYSESMYVYETNKETITRKSLNFFTGGIFGLSSQTIKYYEEGATFSVSFNSLISTHPYPNPTKDVINLKFKNAFTYSSEAKLYDMQGKLVHSAIINLGSTLHKIPIAYQANGIYMLHLTSNDSKEVYKIIKQ